jgi:hypothetical protein
MMRVITAIPERDSQVLQTTAAQALETGGKRGQQNFAKLNQMPALAVNPRVFVVEDVV